MALTGPARWNLAAGLARAAVLAPALAALSWWGNGPVRTAGYVGLLALPCATVEARLVRAGARVAWFHVPLAWLACALAIALAHLQATYALGVLTGGSLNAGVVAVEDEAARLGMSAPGDAGRLVGLRNVDLELVSVAALAVALAGSAVVRPAATFGGALPRLWAWAWVHVLAFSAGAVGVTVFALGPIPWIVPIVAAMMLPVAVPACAAVVVASFVGDHVAAALGHPVDWAATPADPPPT